MLEEGIRDARAWLKSGPGELDERPPHLLFHTPAAPQFADGRPCTTVVSIAVAVETAQTFRDGSAQRRLAKLGEWRARRPGRWVALFIPAEVAVAETCGLPINQVMRYPFGAPIDVRPVVEAAAVTG